MIKLCCGVLICTVHLTICSCRVTYAFQSEFTLYSCLDVEELVARSRRQTCRVWIHSETSRWHDKNVQSNAPYRQVLTTQQTYLVSLAKWLSVRLWTKWLKVRVKLLSQNVDIKEVSHVPTFHGHFWVSFEINVVDYSFSKLVKKEKLAWSK